MDRPPTQLLDNVASPADLKALDRDQLRQLADELRAEVVDAVSVTGGAVEPGVKRSATIVSSSVSTAKKAAQLPSQQRTGREDGETLRLALGSPCLLLLSTSTRVRLL